MNINPEDNNQNEGKQTVAPSAPKSNLNRIILFVLLIALVLTAVSSMTENSSGSDVDGKKSQVTNSSDNLATTQSTSEICGVLRTVFLKNTAFNFSNCTATGQDSIEISLWTPSTKPEDVTSAPVFNDMTTPPDQAKNICDTFFRTFPVLKKLKFNILAADQNTRVLQFDVTFNICSMQTSKSLNSLSDEIKSENEKNSQIKDEQGDADLNKDPSSDVKQQNTGSAPGGDDAAQ